MAAERQLMGLFTDADQVIKALRDLKEASWTIKQVHGPIPHHEIAAQLDLPKSRVGLYTLTGGIIGFFSGFLLASYCSVQYDLIVSGKPIVALIPFFIVGFEFTILFSVFGNVIGLLNEGGLPDYKGLEHYDPRCSGEHFGITATCDVGGEAALRHFFQERGAQVTDLDEIAQPA